MPFPNTRRGRMARKRYRRSIKRKGVYEALRARGMPKSQAAAIANAGRTKKRRRTMAKKAARHRR